MTPDKTEAVLDKAPHAWDPPEVELVKRSFQERRPTVPRRLVTQLWRYWRQHEPDQMLFADDEDNLALVLHAKAFDIPIPVVDTDDPLANLIGRIEDAASCGPLLPRPLAWGPRAALAPAMRAAPSSTLIRVWVVTDDHGPVEVLAIGEGLPEIRMQLMRAALRASLSINGLAAPETNGFITDVIGVGVVRVTAPVASKASATGLPSAFGDRSVAVSQASAQTARGALRDLMTILRRLERDTKLVEITEVAEPEIVAFGQEIRSLAEQAAARPDTAFLRAATAAGPQGVASLLPYMRTSSEEEARYGSSVGIELSADLLTTGSYRQLEQAHQRVLTERLAIDAKLRRDSLEAEIEHLRSELNAFQRASEVERRLMWDSTIKVDVRFDEPTGMTFRLPEPEEIDTTEYFSANVPRLIEMREGWALRMAELIWFIEAAVSRPNAPARQVAAGRFLDAALRGVVPDESPATTSAFQRWRDNVAPMLQFEWRCALRRQGIALDDLGTRHTVFLTRYLPAIDDDEAVLFSQAYSIVDAELSAVLSDSARRVLVFRDVTDHAVDEPVGAADTDEAVAAAEASWRDLERLAGKADCTEAAFNSLFLDTLRDHPKQTVQRLAKELHPSEPSPTEADTIDNELRRAVRATSLSEGMERALMAMRTSAFMTARQCLEDVHAEPNGEARAWLLRAVVECVAADLPYREIPELLGNQVPGLPAAALRAIDEAVGLDRAYTTRWLNALPEADLDKAIRRLFQNLPRARASCSEREYAVWLFHSAMESARLARQLDKATEELSEDSEAVDTTLVKLGGTLEEILLGQFVGGTRNEAQTLFEILTGQVPPRYGQAGVR
jgi:hypothetical protein